MATEMAYKAEITLQDILQMEKHAKQLCNMVSINAQVLQGILAEAHPTLVVYVSKLIEANLVAQNNAMWASMQINAMFKTYLKETESASGKPC